MMVSRRSVLKVGLGLCGCAICNSGGLGIGIRSARADQQVGVVGHGYDLHFIGTQRETVMNGKLAASLDLRTLARTPHLYGLGPIEHLRGEVTIGACASRAEQNGSSHRKL
jgi:hypothetical protein